MERKRKIFTTSFRPDILKKLRLTAAEECRGMNEVLEEAFNEYYTKKIMEEKKL